MLTEQQIDLFHELGRKACERRARNFRDSGNARAMASSTFVQCSELRHGLFQHLPRYVMEWQSKCGTDLSSLLRLPDADRPAAVAALQAGALAYAEELDG